MRLAILISLVLVSCACAAPAPDVRVTVTLTAEDALLLDGWVAAVGQRGTATTRGEQLAVFVHEALAQIAAATAQREAARDEAEAARAKALASAPVRRMIEIARKRAAAAKAQARP